MGKVDDLLAFAIPRRCVLCNAGSGDRNTCRGCAADLPWLAARGAGRVFAALSYEYPVDRMVTAAKFRGQLYFALALGELLADALGGVSRPDLVVPVPLHRSRLASRGYNQAFEIARPVAERFGVPLDVRLCDRVRATAEQSGLDAAARRVNLRGAFRVNRRCDGLAIAIVDDVVTTGSTAAALAAALRAAGTARIDVWAPARAL